MRILVVNAGSSSLKLRVLEGDDRVSASLDLPAASGRADDSAVDDAIRRLPSVDAVGHRIVHGGTDFSEAVLIDDAVVARLTALSDLAPLHQPPALAALAVVSELLSDRPGVACFDTAFHASIPAAAATYALPAEWRRRWTLSRFGFHGLSHAYASRRAAEILGKPPEGLRLVTCHLGAGASLAAVRDGRSVDTTMGFTPLEGLVMATRSGTVDPGLLLWLQQHAGIGARELAATLEHRSGLAGLAGTSDMRAILAAADSGAADARLAVGVYVHRLRGAIGAMAAAMGGVDALVFTGGVGENAPAIRERAVRGLEFLGAGIDDEANRSGTEDRDISATGATVRTLVVAAREDLQIAQEVRTVVRE